MKMRRLYKMLKTACESDSTLMQHRSEHNVTGNLHRSSATHKLPWHQTEEPQVKTMQTSAPNERIPWVSSSRETLNSHGNRPAAISTLQTHYWKDPDGKEQMLYGCHFNKLKKLIQHRKSEGWCLSRDVGAIGQEHCGYFSAEQVQVPFFPELPLRPHTCLEAGIRQEKLPHGNT